MPTEPGWKVRADDGRVAVRRCGPTDLATQGARVVRDTGQRQQIAKLGRAYANALRINRTSNIIDVAGEAIVGAEVRYDWNCS